MSGVAGTKVASDRRISCANSAVKLGMDRMEERDGFAFGGTQRPLLYVAFVHTLEVTLNRIVEGVKFDPLPTTLPSPLYDSIPGEM